MTDTPMTTAVGALHRARTLPAWPALVVLLVLAAIIEPAFFRPSNLTDVLGRASILGIVVVGQVVVMQTAGIDLSVAAVIGLTAVAVAESTRPDGPGLLAGLAVMLGVALAVGTINGLLVTKRNVPPIVATFGMLVTLEGLRVAYTQGSVSGTVPEAIKSLGRGAILGVPFSTLTWLLLIAVSTLYLHRAIGGRWVVMSGANPRMAELSGIPVDRVRVAAYVTSSLLAMISGVFFAGFIGYVDRFVGSGAELDSIAAALLGGTKFSGGEGSFIHAAGGTLLIIALLNLIVVAGWNVQLQMVAKGVVLIGAIALQSLPRRTRALAPG